MADRLERYRDKRDPGATPEPAGDARRGAGRGRARRGSSCRSTTRAACTGTCGSSTTACSPPGRCRAGIPPDPERNHLAVRTEDHPLEYLEFHGEIPAGQYGAGTMTIWDRGTYEVHKFRDDEVMVTFHGERVRGRYVLFRTKGDDWMIHRMDPPDDPDREPMPDRTRADARAHRPAADRRRDAGRSRSSGTACARSRSSQGGRLDAAGAQRSRRHRRATRSCGRSRRRSPGARSCSTARSSRSTARGRASRSSRAACT